MSFSTFGSWTVGSLLISHHFQSSPMGAEIHVRLYPRWLEFIWLDIQHNQTGIDVGTRTRPWWIWATEYCNVILHTTTLSSIWSRSYQRTGYACISSGWSTDVGIENEHCTSHEEGYGAPLFQSGIKRKVASILDHVFSATRPIHIHIPVPILDANRLFIKDSTRGQEAIRSIIEIFVYFSQCYAKQGSRSTSYTWSEN